MEKIPLGTQTCCLPQARGLTYLHVGSERHLVGVMNLEFIFRQLLLLEHSPEAICDAELITMARRFNHIPGKPTVEADYAAALRQAYAEFCALQMPPGRDVAEEYGE